MCAKTGFHGAHWVVGNKTSTGKKKCCKGINTKSKANRMLCKFTLMEEVSRWHLNKDLKD